MRTQLLKEEESEGTVQEYIPGGLQARLFLLLFFLYGQLHSSTHSKGMLRERE